jgi:glycosyltransferase involved in cell wall biosynthesis
MSVSIVVPIYNERENVRLLYDQLVAALPDMGCPWEVLMVDDGSTDGSSDELDQLAREDHRIKIVRFRRNYGQTAALGAGIRYATGDVIVTMDGDLQNDPADIAKMVRKLDEGFDLVHGWRKERHDALVSRKIPSRIANWIISKTTGFPIHDLGCTLKAIRREIAQELELYGEMHRFIPILAHGRGARCVEMVTQHHPRRFGKTKYGISRTIRVVLDLITVKYMLDYFASPMKLFGRLGLSCWGVAALAGMSTLALKLLGGVDMTGNPLLGLTILSIMVGMQFLSLGLLGEVHARVYYASQPNQNYAIRKLVNFSPAGEPPASRWKIAA